MNRKRFFTIIFIGLVAIAITAPASWAGSRGRHRLEGFAIGVGAVLLTKAIIDHNRHDTVTVVQAAPHSGHHRHRHRPAGYWEVRKEWVPATFKKIWNPGHYNRRGIWVRGHWMRIKDQPGHWSKRRVWVPYN